MKPRIFLTAEWRHLVLLNYEVDPAVLEPYVPQGLSWISGIIRPM